MSVLTHDEIMRLIKEGRLVIDPFDEVVVRENGLDLRLGREFAILDLRSEEELRVIEDLAYGKNIEKIDNRTFYVWRLELENEKKAEARRWSTLITFARLDFARVDGRLKPSRLILPVLNVHDFDPSVEYKIFKNVEFIVAPPKSSILVTTLEYVKFPEDVIGLCGVRSTFARLGIFLPLTVVDCGFEGELTIELVNTTNKFILIKPGTRFLHIVLIKTVGTAKYLGKYVGQRGVTTPKPVKE